MCTCYKEKALFISKKNCFSTNYFATTTKIPNLLIAANEINFICGGKWDKYRQHKMRQAMRKKENQTIAALAKNRFYHSGPGKRGAIRVTCRKTQTRQLCKIVFCFVYNPNRPWSKEILCSREEAGMGHGIFAKDLFSFISSIICLSSFTFTVHWT